MTTPVIKGLIFSALLVYAAVSDLRRREVSDWTSVSILITALIGTGGSFMGAVLTALPFLIPALIKRGSIGGGDIKLMFACGAVLGVCGGLTQSIISLSMAAIFAIGILIERGRRVYRRTRIPLAPFLCIGGILSFFISNVGGN